MFAGIRLFCAESVLGARRFEILSPAATTDSLCPHQNSRKTICRVSIETESRGTSASVVRRDSVGCATRRRRKKAWPQCGSLKEIELAESALERLHGHRPHPKSGVGCLIGCAIGRLP